MLLEVVRAIDSIGYFRAFAPNEKISDLPGYLDSSWLGASRALSHFLPAGMIGPGATFARTTPDLSLWASSLLYESGLVSHLNRLIGLVRYDLATLELGRSGAIRFVITAEDCEAIDRDAIDWFGHHTKKVHRPFLYALSAVREKWVVQELSARVWRDPTFGIGYSSCRDLEEYFEEHAESHARSLPGHDALPDECKIGPLTFGQYRSAMVTGMARCLKHTAFVHTLLAGGAPPASREILTIYQFDHELRDQWGGLHGLQDDDADTLLEVMGISPADAVHLKSSPDCPQALLIRGGDNCWHMPVFGGLNCPFPWMNRKLKRMFSSDWDRAVNLREAAFIDDLRLLFPEPRFFIPKRLNLLRDGGRVLTDIDTAVFDHSTGTLALFQLKWQDSFEASLRERASRQNNLTKEGNRWIEVVSNYFKGLSGVDRARRLGLPEEIALSAKSVRLFVLTRNGARFSGGDAQDGRAAWYSWFDLLRQCHGLKRPTDPLSELWKIGCRKRKPRKQRGIQIFELSGVQIETVMA